jgi:inosine kinase
MKFPGKRKTRHYFPVKDKAERPALESDFSNDGSVYVIGIDQILVDIEIAINDEFLNHYQFKKSQSFVIEDSLAEEIYQNFKKQGKISGEFPGGAIGNTLHNYSVLSDSPSIALGTINKNIQVGDYAYQYLCKTNANVNLAYLQPCDRAMGRALCFISEDGERTFAVSKGCMDDLNPEFVPSELIKGAASLLISAYSLRDESTPIAKANIRACELALEANVPVVMSMGTSSLVCQKKDFFKSFIKKYVSVVAMNQDEAECLTDNADPLLSCQELLDITDMALVTVGKSGLYLSSYVDKDKARVTKDPLHTKSIVEYNQYEYSRAMKKEDCSEPVKIFTHINPFMGGPLQIQNTNGAGDAALSAILHDMSANSFHRAHIPNSPKHAARYLTYSSLSQISKYANRVSFEVLIQNSPRLVRGLPAKEDSLEEAYWDN